MTDFTFVCADPPATSQPSTPPATADPPLGDPMPARITATFTQPTITEEDFCGFTIVIPGVTVEVECGPDTIAAAMTALDWAVAEVKAQLAAADPMRVVESGQPAQDTPHRTRPRD